MTAIRVFDPAMCCSTGVCGPSVDPQLARFAADLGWLKSQGVSVERFNLSQQPGAFAENAAVKAILETRGESGLPLVEVNGDVKSSGTYPSRDDLASWAGIGAPAQAESRPRKSALPLAGAESAVAGAGGCCTPADGAAPGAAGTGGCCAPPAGAAAASSRGGRCC